MKRNEPTFPPLPSFYCSQARTSSPESVSALLLSKKENFSTFEQKPLDNFTAELKSRGGRQRKGRPCSKFTKNQKVKAFFSLGICVFQAQGRGIIL